ncbi:hypothetical protein [Bradyrhizobium sp. UFLA05-112]
MTSIAATSTSSYSPLDLLKSELTKEVSAGTISSSDESALSSALDDIDSALKSDGSSSSSSTPPSPDEMQSKIDNLIQNEVSSGKLTSDQADELKNVFANTFSNGAGAPPPPPDASSDSSSTSSTDSISSSTSSADLMKELIALLQNATSQSTSYSSSGNVSSSSASSSLLVDYKT